MVQHGYPSSSPSPMLLLPRLLGDLSNGFGWALLAAFKKALRLRGGEGRADESRKSRKKWAS